jgi:hypothetical protein
MVILITFNLIPNVEQDIHHINIFIRSCGVWNRRHILKFTTKCHCTKCLICTSICDPHGCAVPSFSKDIHNFLQHIINNTVIPQISTVIILTGIKSCTNHCLL